MMFNYYFYFILFIFVISDRDVTFGIRALFSKDFWGLRGVSLSYFACETVCCFCVLNLIA